MRMYQKLEYLSYVDIYHYFAYWSVNYNSLQQFLYDSLEFVVFSEMSHPYKHISLPIIIYIKLQYYIYKYII